MLVSGGGGGVDLNWFLQFLFTLFIIAVGLLHLVKNTASKYFEVDANFESTPPRESAVVIENSGTSTTNNSSSSDHLHLSSPMPNEDTACAHCRKPATKKCSGCKAVRYCSHKCQEAHWKSGHKTKCKDLRPPGVNSTAGSGRKTSGLGGKSCSGIALIPAHGRGISKPIKQPKKILFPYEEFVNFFNWDKPGFPPCGLLNCGNSCYANVVLQCLAFTRPLVAYLLEKGHRRECNRDDWCFLCEFQTHVERASQSLQAFSPINILSRLPNIGGNLGYGRQEDAHEFMRFAIDTMQSVCLDEFGGEKAVDSSSQETTLIQHIFGGHLQSQVICTKCNNISNQYESMMDLTVEIHGDAASLEECLEQFTAKECLNGENMYKCDCCNDYVKAWKRLTVKKAPNILTIALKRFQSGRFGKLNKRVTFPETLNLSPYMSEPGDGTDEYKLYAVVVHLDLLNASFYGHYNCYTKDFRGNWYKIDDCKVTSVELNEVLSQEAYMLFYSRVSARPSCLRPIEPSVEQQQQMVQVTAAPCLNEQVECSTTVESLNHMNGFAVSSDDSSPCPKVSSCEEESSTGINPVALKENHQDVEVVYVESSSVSKEVASCETESYFGISIEDLREEPEDINMTNSGSHSPISVEFSSYGKEPSAAFNSVAGREDPEDVNMADSEWCPAELKEVSCSEMDPVSMDCKFLREDSGDKEVESRPSVAKHAEVYGNGHIEQNEIPCREERAHKPVSAETHKLKCVPPLHNSDCEDGNGAERVGIMGMAPDWSSIPVDLLRLVANKVHSLEDYVHFGAVCWSWYRASTSPKNNLKSLFPWVMLADRENNDSRGFYSLSSNKVYEFDLPETVGKRCWGSPFGWLVIAAIDNMEIQLFNPLSRASISLPSRTTFMGDENENSIMHYWSVNKVVISSNPPNCIVMAIYSCYRKLAFAKPGDHVWSKIRLDSTIGTGFSDITYFNGDFFIAKCTGQLLVCDFSGIDPVAIEFAPSPPGVADEAMYLLYLVDLGGELCMVFRYFDVIGTINNISMKTRSFEVYKLDMNTKTWKQMDSLGDWSLFVGNNYTFSVRDFGYTDCRSSCIYFTHDYCQCSDQISGNDTGIYNYKGGEIHALPVSQDLYSVLRPPLWITPQLF